MRVGDPLRDGMSDHRVIQPRDRAGGCERQAAGGDQRQNRAARRLPRMAQLRPAGRTPIAVQCQRPRALTGLLPAHDVAAATRTDGSREQLHRRQPIQVAPHTVQRLGHFTARHAKLRRDLPRRPVERRVERQQRDPAILLGQLSDELVQAITRLARHRSPLRAVLDPGRRLPRLTAQRHSQPKPRRLDDVKRVTPQRDLHIGTELGEAREAARQRIHRDIPVRILELRPRHLLAEIAVLRSDHLDPDRSSSAATCSRLNGRAPLTPGPRRSHAARLAAPRRAARPIARRPSCALPAACSASARACLSLMPCSAPGSTSPSQARRPALAHTPTCDKPRSYH